jgi:hypothetical protein
MLVKVLHSKVIGKGSPILNHLLHLSVTYQSVGYFALTVFDNKALNSLKLKGSMG